MARRSLTLRRETLTPLSPAELAAVVGADELEAIPTAVLQAANCLTLAGPGCIT